MTEQSSQEGEMEEIQLTLSPTKSYFANEESSSEGEDDLFTITKKKKQKILHKISDEDETEKPVLETNPTEQIRDTTKESEIKSTQNMLEEIINTSISPIVDKARDATILKEDGEIEDQIFLPQIVRQDLKAPSQQQERKVSEIFPEAVLDQRKRKGKQEYYIKWKNYPQSCCTWELEETLLEL